MRRVHFDELAVSDDGYGDLLLDGDLFDGVAWDADPAGARAETAYKMGHHHGPARSWYPSGALQCEEYFWRGGRHGAWREWSAEGELVHEEIWQFASPVVRRRWQAGLAIEDVNLIEAEPARGEAWLRKRLARGPCGVIELIDDELVEVPWPFDALIPAALRARLAAAVPITTPAHERATLALVRQGGAEASGPWIATRLPRYDVPLEPDAMAVLASLRDQGLLDEHPARWSLTERGRQRLLAGPLAITALTALCVALRASVERGLTALAPLADDGPRIAAALRQVLVADVTLAERIAAAAARLPPAERVEFADDLLRDARAPVRAALFAAWAARAAVLPAADWHALVQRGLADDDATVRAAAERARAEQATSEDG